MSYVSLRMTRDVTLVESVIGVGEIAISDHRSRYGTRAYLVEHVAMFLSVARSWPSYQELVQIVRPNDMLRFVYPEC